MSRNVGKLNENIIIAQGSDHALGAFLDIMDLRFSKHPYDMQGEGYVMEYSTLFGFSSNFIGATVEDFKIPGSLEKKVDIFIAKLPAIDKNAKPEDVEKEAVLFLDKLSN